MEDAAENRDERIERNVIKPIEDAMAILLRSGLKPGVELSERDRTTVATFVALMSLRTRLAHQEIGDFAAEVSETALLMACAMAESDPRSAQVRELLKTHRLRIGPKMPMLISLSLLRDFTYWLNQMGWSLITSGPHDHFIASDDPYRQVDPDANPPSAHGALGARNAEVSLPLTRSLAFFAGWQTQGTRWVQAPPGFVEEINRRTCMTAAIIVAPEPIVPGFDQILKDWEVRKPHMKNLRILA
jgi:hypothetical protein